VIAMTAAVPDDSPSVLRINIRELKVRTPYVFTSYYTVLYTNHSTRNATEAEMFTTSQRASRCSECLWALSLQ
jgi:hypothetical protein